MDFSLVSAAPWHARKRDLYFGPGTDWGVRCKTMPKDIDAQFMATARNAFDVMMRRHWSVALSADDLWMAVDAGTGEQLKVVVTCDDPYTALVEADNWYRENVDDKIKK